MQKFDILLMHNSGRTNLFNIIDEKSVCVWKIESTSNEPPYNHLAPTLRLIMSFNGTASYPAPVQQFMVQQYTKGVPLLLFPYSAGGGSLQLGTLKALHPLQSGNPSKSAVLLKNDVQLHVPTHPIVQNVKRVICDSKFSDSCHANEQATLIASWYNGNPMVAEWNNIVAINVCLTNSDPKDGDMKLMVQQAMQYLLEKNKKNQWQMRLYTISKYHDIIINI